MAGGIIGTILGGALTGGIGPAIGAALPSITDTAKILVDRLVPDPNAKAAAQAELEQALAARDVAATFVLFVFSFFVQFFFSFDVSDFPEFQLQ